MGDMSRDLKNTSKSVGADPLKLRSLTVAKALKKGEEEKAVVGSIRSTEEDLITIPVSNKEIRE